MLHCITGTNEASEACQNTNLIKFVKEQKEQGRKTKQYPVTDIKGIASNHTLHSAVSPAVNAKEITMASTERVLNRTKVSEDIKAKSQLL